jgi:hypothetical protein
MNVFNIFPIAVFNVWILGPDIDPEVSSRRTTGRGFGAVEVKLPGLKVVVIIPPFSASPQQHAYDLTI